SFDRVSVSFRLPTFEGDPDFELKTVHIHQLTSDVELTPDMLPMAYENPPFSAAELPATSGLVTLEVGELWADYTYQFAVRYVDKCANSSEIVTAEFTTELQKFQTVDSFCFVATAAYGAPWLAQVVALRAFRDAYLKSSATGIDLVRFYYTYS